MSSDDSSADRMEALRRVVSEPNNGPVLKKFVLTSLAMIALPLMAFFGVRHYTSSFLEPGGRNLWAAIAAAVTANLVIVYYVIVAWNEDSKGHAFSKKIE